MADGTKQILAFVAAIWSGVFCTWMLTRRDLQDHEDRIGELENRMGVHVEGGNAIVEIHPSDWQLGLYRMYRNKLNREDQEHGM